MKNVTTATNAINTMLHVHSAQATESFGNTSSSQQKWQEQICANATYNAAHEEEQSLNVVTHCLRNFGADALQELENHVERLQEEFLAHLHMLLQEKKIRLDEKLVLSLSNENTLVLQCQEHEEALLTALGENEALHDRLQELRSTALLAHGLHYALSAHDTKVTNNLAQYNVCVKGMLSHFYLK